MASYSHNGIPIIQHINSDVPALRQGIAQAVQTAPGKVRVGPVGVKFPAVGGRPVNMPGVQPGGVLGK